MKKFTNLDEEILKENLEISKKIESNTREIFKKLDDIKIGVDDLLLKQVKESNNWGYVGTLDKINYELDDILVFLGVKEAE